MAEKRQAESGYTGVEVRGQNVRVRVPFRGKWVWETVETLPTPKGLKEAARIRQEVIDRSKFGEVDWVEFFPKSNRIGKHYEAIPTFEECAVKYLGFCANVDSKSPSTIRGYKKRLDGIWIPSIGDMDIDRIKRSHIREVVSKHEWKSGKTFANALTPAKGVFTLAIEDEFITSNPVEGIKAPKWQKPVPDPLTREEMVSVLKVIPDYWRPYFQVAFGTGMRTSELIGLKWRSVKLDQGTVLVHEARVMGQDKTTKTHESRTIPVLPLAGKGFEGQRDISFKVSPYVFLKPGTDEPLDGDETARRIWNHALRHAEVRHRKAYSTRHTFATLLLMAGEPIERISKWLGHRTPTMTYDHYATWVEAVDSGPTNAARDALGSS